MRLGARVDARDKGGATALFLAAEAGHVPAVARLLAAGADVTQANAAGESPLYIAALRGHVAAVGALLQHCEREGVPWDDGHQYEDGWTPLMAAAVGGREDVLELLLEYAQREATAASSGRDCGSPAGGFINAPNRYGQTAVHIAARRGSPALLRALLDAGGCARAQDMYGATPLSVAASQGHHGAVRMLEEAARTCVVAAS